MVKQKVTGYVMKRKGRVVKVPSYLRTDRGKAKKIKLEEKPITIKVRVYRDEFGQIHGFKLAKEKK